MKISREAGNLPRAVVSTIKADLRGRASVPATPEVRIVEENLITDACPSAARGVGDDVQATTTLENSSVSEPFTSYGHYF